MEPIRFGKLLKYCLPPLFESEDDTFLVDSYLLSWIILAYFLLVQTLERQLMLSLETSDVLLLPLSIKLLVSPFGVLAVAAFLASIPLVVATKRLGGLTGLKDTLSGMILAWKFNSDGKAVIVSVGLDLMAGALIGILLGFAIFPIGILIGIPLAGLIFLVLFGLGLPFFISLYVSILLGWASLLPLLLLGIRRFKPEPPADSSPIHPVLSERAKEILLSDSDPILCPSCGSFNASHRTFCAVCNEPLDQD